MKARIAVATVDHSIGIAAVAAEALAANVDVDSPGVARVLDAGNTLVATADGKVVGFVSNFATGDELGRRRFELDLLGVAQAWRGRGIGARLVDCSLRVARASGASTARALVRRDNKPMQRICRRRGLERSARSYQLYVSRAKTPARNCGRHTKARIIAVDTLTYSGYWLEGELSQCAVSVARHLLGAGDGRSLLGAVVPAADRATIELLRANSFERVGDFDWWTLNL